MSSHGVAGESEGRQTSGGLLPEEPGLPWAAEPIWRALKRVNRSQAAREKAAPPFLPVADPVKAQPWGQEAPGLVPYQWRPSIPASAPLPRGAAVSSYARRLIAQERRRILRTTPLGGRQGLGRKSARTA